MSKIREVARDVKIVAALDVIVLACVHAWLNPPATIGWVAYLRDAVLPVLIPIVSTAIAGALIDRLIVGALGIAGLWIVFAVSHLSPSSTSFGSDVGCCLMLFGVQGAVFLVAHVIARW